jgi:hypothetical protein
MCSHALVVTKFPRLKGSLNARNYIEVVPHIHIHTLCSKYHPRA